MPKQIFEFYDYLGPMVAAVIFAFALLIISFCFLNFFLINPEMDELTVFEKIGSRRNVRLGPHSLSFIKRRRDLKKCSFDAAGETKGEDNSQNNIPVQIPEVNVEAASTS